MSISTKTGDDGTTGLWSGERVAKDDARVEAMGSVDELDSQLGLSLHSGLLDENRLRVEETQGDLFRVAGTLATVKGDYVKPILQADAERLTAWVLELESRVPLKGFVLPGSTPSSAALDLCRTAARRAERRIVALGRDALVPQPLREYVNRLSDLLFMMARLEEQSAGKIRYKKW